MKHLIITITLDIFKLISVFNVFAPLRSDQIVRKKIKVKHPIYMYADVVEILRSGKITVFVLCNKRHT